MSTVSSRLKDAILSYHGQTRESAKELIDLLTGIENTTSSGTATLVAGQATVLDSTVKANSLIFLTAQNTPASNPNARPNLLTADTYAVLAGSTITNTGSTTLTGDVGVSPGTTITGSPTVTGSTHAGDAAAAQAKLDLTAAYLNLQARTPTQNLSGQDLGGLTLSPGVYKFNTSAQLTGTVTLNGGGDPNAVFIFQIGSTLTTASSAVVSLTNSTQAGNVFWQVGTSATLGTSTTFKGNVLAQASITATTSATVSGRLLAQTGAVTLDTNTVNRVTAAGSGPTSTTGISGVLNVQSIVPGVSFVINSSSITDTSTVAYMVENPV